MPALLVCVASGCDDAPATLVVLSDTTAASPWRVVVALPFDPAELPIVPAEPIPEGRHGDSVRLALARHDSATRAAAAFERARMAANEAATELASGDRRSPEYARRFDSWKRLADSAESLRTTRDRLRQRLTALLNRLGPAAPDLDANGDRVRSREAADSMARVIGREPVFSTIRNGEARLVLPPGEWWLARTSEENVLLPALRLEVEAGGVDTIRVNTISANSSP